MRLLEQYDLDLSKTGKKEPVRDVDAYWAFSLYFDLENKTLRVIYEALVGD